MNVYDSELMASAFKRRGYARAYEPGDADVILVIDGGRIIERGTHEELIGHRGRYHALYTRQYQRERSMMY